MLALAAFPFRARGAVRSHVTGVHFRSYRDFTRIRINTSGPFTLRCDRLDHPSRLFFDLVGSASGLGKGIHTITVGDALVRQIRVAETQHGITRVVLDLNQPARFTTTHPKNSASLVIELRSESSPAAAMASAPAREASFPSRPFTLPPARSIPTMAALMTPPELDPFDMGLDSAAIYSRDTASREVARLFAPSPIHAPKTRVVASVRTPRPLDRVPETTKSPALPAAPARRSSGEAESLTRALGLKIHRVVIDAGHGGHDTGTIGAGGLLEKDLVLDVALRLGNLIEQRMGAEVVYTRSDDTFIPLQDRTRIANESHADLFLSIHANSSPERSATGVETYYLNFTTSQSALELAARENSSSDQTIFELKDLLQKIALQDKIDESREFGACVQKALYNASLRIDARSKDRGVRKAPFVVLIGASMPSVLAEIGFISNPHDANALRKNEARRRIAEALYRGVSQYANSLSHYTVAQRVAGK
jgi:N-acetylmuramoyl-L-alanine amidase